MTDEEFETFVKLGRDQCEIVNQMQQSMMPVLVVFNADGPSINGLGGPPELWPTMFADIAARLHPTAAVLTGDAFLGTDLAVRPRDDAKARNALTILGVEKGRPPRSRVLPYAVNDDGSLTWLEPKHTTAFMGPVQEALEAMVNP